MLVHATGAPLKLLVVSSVKPFAELGQVSVAVAPAKAMLSLGAAEG